MVEIIQPGAMQRTPASRRGSAKLIPEQPVENSERAGLAGLCAQRDALRQVVFEPQQVLRAAEALLEGDVEIVRDAFAESEELLRGGGAAAAAAAPAHGVQGA